MEASHNRAIVAGLAAVQHTNLSSAVKVKEEQKMSSKDRYEKTFSRKKKETKTTTIDTNKSAQKQPLRTLQKPKSEPKINGPKPTKITIKINPPTKNQIPISTKKVKPEKDEILIKDKKRKAGNDNVESETIMSMKINKKKEKDEILIKEMKKNKEKDEEESLECVFPTARITRIVKSENPDCKITGEAVFLINKATEKFIELFSEDAYGCAVEDKKNFVGYKHLSSAVSKGKSLDFLSDFVPEKVTAEKALAERNPPSTLPS